MRKNNSENFESVEFRIDPVKHPIAFGNRVQSLIESGLSREEAEIEALEPIDMELYYDKDSGLFLVEEGAVESVDITNPYKGELMEDFIEE